MANVETVLWGIHAGKTGDADSLFLRKNVIAVGWTQIGDLSKLGADFEAFKAAVAKAYPEKKPGAIPNYAGQLFRFARKMKPGDLVAYPSKHDKHIHLGRVDGDYYYDEKTKPDYPHLRPVKWLKSVPRTSFTRGIHPNSQPFSIQNFIPAFTGRKTLHLKIGKRHELFSLYPKIGVQKVGA